MKTNEFFKKYGGWLLAGLSCIGVVATAILAGDEVPKAKEAIDKEEYERQMQFCAESQKKFEDDPELKSVPVPDLSLTLWEKTKVAFPILLPSVITGGLTITSIVVNQVFNEKQINVLSVAATGYSALKTEYENYRKVIRDTQGEEIDEQAYKMAQMRIEALEDELARYKEENGPYLYSIATIPGLIFEAKPADIQEAFLHFNRNLVLRGTNDLAELYAFIGIPETCYNQDDSFQYGWNDYENQISWESSFVDFDIDEVETGNGTPVRMITMAIPPYDLTVDYSDENMMDHEFPGYNMKLTKQCIEGAAQVYWDQVIKIDHPYIHRMGLI